jgi:hypothetical protein
MSLARYADETPQQQQRAHRRIAKRYRKKQEPSALIVSLFKVALEKVYAGRYGRHRLPDDDAGRDDLRIMMDILMQRREHGEDHCRRWVATWMPELPDHELDDILDTAGRRWTPAALGKALNLTNAERMQRGVRIILPVDRTRKQLDQDIKDRDAERKRRDRAKLGAKPRAGSAAQTKEWEARGESRATWYRKRRNETRETNSSAINFFSYSGRNSLTGVPKRPQGASLRHAPNPWHALMPLNDSFPTEPREPKFIVVTASCCNVI